MESLNSLRDWFEGGSGLADGYREVQTQVAIREADGTEREADLIIQWEAPEGVASKVGAALWVNVPEALYEDDQYTCVDMWPADEDDLTLDAIARHFGIDPHAKIWERSER